MIELKRYEVRYDLLDKRSGLTVAHVFTYLEGTDEEDVKDKIKLRNSPYDVNFISTREVLK